MSLFIYLVLNLPTEVRADGSVCKVVAARVCIFSTHLKNEMWSSACDPSTDQTGNRGATELAGQRVSLDKQMSFRFSERPSHKKK